MPKATTQLSQKRAASYARVSTDEQAKGFSLQTQLDANQAYMIERGYEAVAEFSEDYTGASLDRPELDRVRELAASKAIDVVIVYDIDRLARKSIYQMLIEEELLKYGVKVEYVLGQYEDTDEGRLQKQIRASIAEYEKAKILERSKRGKRGKAKSGSVLVGARPPYGYVSKAEGHTAWLEVEESEAVIVRRVFDWFVNGDETGRPLSTRTIARRLTDLHLPTRGDVQAHVAKKLGYGVWQPAMISHILKNEVYVGRWHFGKTQMVSDGKEGLRTSKSKRGLGRQVARTREEWITVAVPAIVDEYLWEVAQERLNQSKELYSGRPAKYQYLLSRRLKCGQCGYHIKGHTVRDKYQYYICKGCEQIVKLCTLPRFHGQATDETAWAWVKNVLQHPDQVAAGLRASQAEAQQANHTISERLNLVQAQRLEAQQQLTRLLDLYLSGQFAKEVLTERKARLESSMNDLLREEAELSLHLQTMVITDEQVAELEAFCAEIRVGLENATFEDKQRYLALLDLHGTLAEENDERILYLKCNLGKQKLSLMQTSHSSNTGAIVTRRSGSRRTRH